MKKSLISILSVAMLLSLAACGNNDKNTSNNDSVSQSSLPTSETSKVETVTDPNESESSSLQTTTATVETETITETQTIPSETITSDDIEPSHGMNLILNNMPENVKGKLDVKENQDNFKNWINHNAGEEILKSVISDTAVENKTCIDDQGVETTFYSIGSQKAGGELNLTFTKKLSQLSFLVKGYYNYIDNAYAWKGKGWYNDKDISLKAIVDGKEQEFAITSSETGIPESTYVTIALKQPTSKIILKTNPGEVVYTNPNTGKDSWQGRRVLLEEMRLDYKDSDQ